MTEQLCESCVEECKQLEHSVVHKCPNYRRKGSRSPLGVSYKPIVERLEKNGR